VSFGDAYFHGNPRLLLDYIFGAHASGFLLYGALPASLAALGFLDTSKLAKVGGASWAISLLVSVIPALVLFLLVRQRLGVWYLLRKCLWVRSLVFTVAIITTSALIAYLGFVAPIARSEDARCAQGLLDGIAVLVGSSSIFLTAIQKTTGLPGLPSEEYAVALARLRSSLATIDSDRFRRTKDFDRGALQQTVDEATRTAASLVRQSRAGSGRRHFYETLAKDLGHFREVLTQLENVPDKWSDFVSGDGSALGGADKKLRRSLQHILLVCKHA